MSMQLTYKFNNPNNFYFQNNKIDFSNGKIWDGDYKSDRIFAAKFLEDFNARDKNNNIISYSNLIGDIVIEHSRAHFKNYNLNTLEFNGNDFNLSGTYKKGSINFLFIPEYDQQPSQPLIIFWLGSNQDRKNEININHWNNGILAVTFFDKDGIQAPNTSTTWYPNQNQEYHFELCWNFEDSSNSYIKLFINGNLFLQNNYYIERDTNIDKLIIGNSYNYGYRSQCYIRDFTIFSKILHTSNFEPKSNDAEYFELSCAKLNKIEDFSFLVNFKNHAIDNLNADYADGNIIGVGTNNPTIENGVLALSFNDIRYVDYEFNNNFKTMLQGGIRLGIKPNYSGAPSNNQFFFFLGHGSSYPYLNSFFCYHAIDGTLHINFADINGKVQTSDITWTPSQGTIYHFEINWNLLTKKFYIYIDGQMVFEKVILDNFFRSLDGDRFRLGSNAEGTYSSNFDILYFSISKSVLHDNSITNFIDYDKTNEMIYPVQETHYIEPKTKILTDGLENVGGEVIDTQDGDRRYIVVRENDLLYWDGTKWTISNGSWEQSNDPITMITNLSKLDLTDGYNCTFRILLYSNNGLESDAIKTIEINYNYFGGNSNPSKTYIVWGYEKDPAGNPIVGMKIQYFLVEDGYENHNHILNKIKMETTTNKNGYWEAPLIPNNKISPKSKYKFIFKYKTFKKVELVYTEDNTQGGVEYKTLKKYS